VTGKAALNQHFVLRRKASIIQLHRASNEQLPLLDGKRGQLLKNLCEAHCRSLTGLCKIYQLRVEYFDDLSQRDCVTQPRVAMKELPWVIVILFPYPNGVTSSLAVKHFNHLERLWTLSKNAGTYTDTPGMTLETIRRLPRSEKLKLMEALWEELRRPDSDYESPAWHAHELKETEQRFADGREQVLDWNTARKKLRNRFE